MFPHSSFSAKSMCISVCCCRPGVESWLFVLVTECHSLICHGYRVPFPHSSFSTNCMCISVCCCRPGVESWLYVMVTECHQLHFTVSTLIHCVQCTKPHPPLHILSSPAAYIGLCYFLVCSQLLILIYRVQHCSSLLVNIVTVLQQTLNKCEESGQERDK